MIALLNILSYVLCVLSATLLFFVAALVAISSPLVPATTRVIFRAFYIGFTNIMACTVFRGVALGMMQTENASFGLSSTRVAAAFRLEPLFSSRRSTDTLD